MEEALEGIAEVESAEEMLGGNELARRRRGASEQNLRVSELEACERRVTSGGFEAIELSETTASGNGQGLNFNGSSNGGSNNGYSEQFGQNANGRNLDDDGLPMLCTTDNERMKLVDAAFDEIGIGLYHLGIFFTASLGFFVEAAEMSILSLLLAKFPDLWHVPETDLSVIPSMTAIGMVAGTLVFGRLSDVIGRKVVYHVSLSCCILFGYISSYASSIMVFAVLRMFTGFGYGGNLVSAATLLLESTPTQYRGFFSALTTFSFTLGGLFISGFSWLFMDSWGWESIVRITSLLGLPVCIILFYMPGSVRFYIMNQRYEEAVRVVERIARVNGKPTPKCFSVQRLEGVHVEEDEDSDGGPISAPGGIQARKPWYVRLGVSMFCDWRVMSALLPLMAIWFLNSFAYSLFSFLPLELKKRFLDVDKVPYKIAMALGVGSLCGSFVVTCLSTRMKRLTELRLGLCIVASCTLLISQLESSFIMVCGMLVCSHVGISIIYHALYTYTPETFPTSVRVTAFSTCHLSHRLAPIIAPFGVTALTARSFALAATCYASLWYVATAVSFLLFRETLNQPMVESLDEFNRPSRAATMPTYSKLEQNEASPLRQLETVSEASPSVTNQNHGTSTFSNSPASRTLNMA